MAPKSRDCRGMGFQGHGRWGRAEARQDRPIDGGLLRGKEEDPSFNEQGVEAYFLLE